MNEAVRAEILNLSASILLGKAAEKEIKQVCSLAIESDESTFLLQELKDCTRILTERNPP